MALRVTNQTSEALGLEPGDTEWTCLSYGIVYPTPIAQGILAELLFPDDWTLLPPG